MLVVLLRQIFTDLPLRMVRNVLLFTTLIMAASTANSARILAVLPIGAKSHHRFMQPVVTALARAGHQVVLYSPFPTLLDDQPANLTHVLLESISVVDQSADMNHFIQEITDHPFWKCFDLQWKFVDGLYSEVINDKKIKELLSSNEKFDLIVTETLTVQEFITALLSRKFKAPVIGLQAFPSNNVLNNFLGNSLSLSYIPDICTAFSNKMSFVERSANMFSSLRGLYYQYTYYIPKLENMMRKDFPDASPLEGLTEGVALMFVNDHLTADYAQPRTPNIIPVGGIHIQPHQPLPQKIQKFMDEAEQGVIFFSLGTYVLDDLEPEKYFKMYSNVFRSLKQRVIWKTRNENVAGLPANVMTVKWAPQKDILAHPKCVLFITHGGQLSRVEALHFGVPVVSIPQFYDQHKNSAFYEHKGVGVRLTRQDVSEETILAAILKVIHNPRENMKRLSAIFRDQPLSPVESVVFWTEYVLRHGGAAHLRPASTELRWYQLILLDIVIALVLSIALLCCILILILKIFLSFFKSSKTSSHKKIN